MKTHFQRMFLGALVGLVLGACLPMFSGRDFNALPALTAEYALVGGSMGFALSNYLAFRRRLLARIQQSRSEH